MAGEYITLENPLTYPGYGSNGSENGKHRPAQRFSNSYLILLIFLVGSLLIILYAYWDVMMITAVSMPLAKRLDSNDTRLMDGTLAEKLYREVRILCWVLTTPKYHKTRAVHVMRTWGKRCNKIYFMTSERDDELPTVVLTKPDTYEFLWGKTKEAFTYIHDQMRDEADWFIKADDDTYVFLENLRYMLYPYSPEIPIYFGFNYKMIGNGHHKNESYMSGGSGYVLSREALRIFAEGHNDTTKCRQEDDRSEDLEMGKCLVNLGVKAGDSRDEQLRNRFYPIAPFGALLSGNVGMDFWLYKYAYYNARSCMDCLSEYPVAFHYVNSKQLYVYDYFNYQFQLAGRQQVPERLPKKIREEDLVIPESDNTIS
ncbi:glycoprotein-N-acetylgalactosamine 3-beta-galactosyltransferase 1 [Drosophila eugracilis]|uniref:glycoprotein-N-acetylgalactosamine 3-beta-galactosyltransferase 1 n=1 Tax=Drosophila eugracilis TaxID=29029 RepID=UPI0007E7C5A6|nr:glycoprotein-N-acetylgalactosamine 3-beta-galactosyltransferase 1 [Drosophila eugracilis]XP_017064595.1 glycoprotein-N-acetylgalactosamine 3-beta-galactosyltransferase 1 [Drosophila eugracilis]XP_017064596.1 glycoprotein-N-acetylgalactosamine 3-beta-galactosyltransferase 1 [Drosophila eugracilis]XP_017064597.1 glycoprotein-N-acetylgalactosamine 3-beta-galactosyltransferase 1 [Drosophila eugracilis]